MQLSVLINCPAKFYVSKFAFIWTASKVCGSGIGIYFLAAEGKYGLARGSLSYFVLKNILSFGIYINHTKKKTENSDCVTEKFR